jgi:hypothetical protein
VSDTVNRKWKTLTAPHPIVRVWILYQRLKRMGAKNKTNSQCQRNEAYHAATQEFGQEWQMIIIGCAQYGCQPYLRNVFRND